MSDYNILIFYPKPNTKLDLMQGLKAWLSQGGLFEFGLATELAELNPETYVESVRRDYHNFDKNDIETLRPIVEQHDVHVMLNAPWFTMSIVVESYHHAHESLIFWSYNPSLWGLGEGGSRRADAAVLAFARAAGAAYILSVSDLGYEVVRQRFIRNENGYRVVLPPFNPKRGHRMLWVDVCKELGGETPDGIVEDEQLRMPFGYIRHILKGANATKRDGTG